VFVTDSPFIDLDEMAREGTLRNALLWEQKGLTYGWDEKNMRSVNITLSASPDQHPEWFSHLQSNGSLYAHVFASRRGFPLTPDGLVLGENGEIQFAENAGTRRGEFDPTAVVSGTSQLNTYRPPPKVEIRKNLLSGGSSQDEKQAVKQTEDDEDDSDTGEYDTSKRKEKKAWVNYWKPELNIQLVHDFTAFPGGNIPPDLRPVYKLDRESGKYLPPLHVRKSGDFNRFDGFMR